MNGRADFIIPECYIDTNLVETLVCHDGCNHQKGCNHVARIMQTKFAGRFAVGVIDADKRQPGYVAEFHEIATSEHLKLLRHNNRPHFIILISPAADGFILSCASNAEVDITQYGLSPKLKEFTAQTKNVMSNKNPRFKQLFRSLEDSGEIKLMKILLAYLSATTYQSKDSELVAIFVRCNTSAQ